MADEGGFDIDPAEESTQEDSAIHSTDGGVPPSGHAEGTTRRRRAVGVAVVAVLGLAALAVAVAVTAGDDDKESGADVSAGAPLSVGGLPVLNPAPDDADGVKIERRYGFGGGDELVGQIELTNQRDDAAQVSWFESFPSDLARSTDQLHLDPKPTGTVTDPVLVAYWVVDLEPDESRVIDWSRELPEGAERDVRYLRQVEEDQQGAAAAATAVIGRLRARLEDKGAEPVGTTAVTTTQAEGSETTQPGTTQPGQGEGEGDGSSGTTTPGGSTATTHVTTPPTSPNRAPTISVANRANDELAGVNLRLAASDPDGDPLSFTVTGLPSGLRASGATISGTIAHDAVTATQSDSNIRSGNRTVTVVVSDGAASSRASFTWTIRDTHRTMPNYVGKYGCGSCESGGLPDVAALTKNVSTCAYDPSGDGNRIFRQGVAAGAVMRWGQTVTFWYGKNDTGCAHVASGW